MTAETLEQFADRANLLRSQKADQIRFLAWYLHSVSAKERVVTGDLRACFQQLHLDPPNISRYLTYLSEGKGRSFIRDKHGFRLEGKWRQKLNETLGEANETVAVRTLLSELVPKIGNPDERRFLEETLRCYSVKAFRATVVMAWNLAYAHFRSAIFSDTQKLTEFNKTIPVRYPKSSVQVRNADDFDDLKEFEAIEVAQTARIISKNVAEIMKDKLKHRNRAAHPSSIEITQPQADDVVTDLVNNVVLKLA